MIVKSVLLCDVCLKHGCCNHTVLTSYGVCCHLYQLSATSNINLDERTETSRRKK